MPIPLTPSERRLAWLLTAAVLAGLLWNMLGEARPDPPPVRLIRGALAVDSSRGGTHGALYADGGTRVSLPGGTGDSLASGPVDIRTAGSAELERLPGVGPVLAARIVSWRQERTGPWVLEDLVEVRGVGPATLGRLRAYLEAAEGSGSDSARGGL